MNTPMKLRLKSFQLVTRKAFSYAQSITWLGRVEAGVCKSDTSYIFLHLSKIMGTSIQHLKFLLFYGEFSFNEKNKAAMVLKAICPHKHKFFSDPIRCLQQLHICNCRENSSFKGICGIRKIILMLPRSTKAGPIVISVIVRSPLTLLF